VGTGVGVEGAGVGFVVGAGVDVGAVVGGTVGRVVGRGVGVAVGVVFPPHATPTTKTRASTARVNIRRIAYIASISLSYVDIWGHVADADS